MQIFLRILLIFFILITNFSVDSYAQDSKKDKKRLKKEKREANKRYGERQNKKQTGYDQIYSKYEYTEKEKAMRVRPVLLDTMSRRDKSIYYKSYRKDYKRKKAIEKYKRDRFLASQTPETRERMKQTAKNTKKRRRKARGNIFQRTFRRKH